VVLCAGFPNRRKKLKGSCGYDFKDESGDALKKMMRKSKAR
jgi:hypothetical protein